MLGPLQKKNEFNYIIKTISGKIIVVTLSFTYMITDIISV